MTQQTVTLDEACLVITDGTHYTPKAQETGRPFLTVKDMLDGRLDFKTCSRISEADFQNAARNGCCPQTGDVLFSKDGTVGKVHPFTSEEDCAVLSSIAILRPRREVLDQGYFAHFLRSDSFLRKALRNKTGSAIRRIILANLRNLEIPLPPLEEQRRIAAILDKAGSLQAHDRLREKTLSSFEDSLFRHFFGGIAEQANRWHWQKFGDLCSRLTVGVVVKPASYYCENGVPALRSLNVKAGAISEENLVFISDRDNNGTLAKSRLATGDLVFVRSGRPGTCAVIPPGLDGCNAIDLLLATVDQSGILPEFVSSYFNSHGGRASILSESRGQIQQHFNAGSLAKASIPVPPVTLQQEFCAVLNQIRLQAKRCDSSLAALGRLSSALSSEFFGGS